MSGGLIRIATVFPAVMLLFGGVASAQVSIGPEGVFRVGGEAERGPRNRQVYQIVVTPAPEPDPPLKYALYPRSYELQPGNSVPYWYRAMFEFGRQEAQGGYDTFNENMHAWLDGPVSELPVDEVREFLSLLESAFHEARVAALREETDWDLRLYDLRGSETIYFRLPEFQESRTLARFVALRSRLAIAERDYPEAIEWFRVNFRLGRDVAQPETLINQLVGTAIISIACDDLIDLIAAPGSPNLYWALASIPRPPIDYRTSYEFEQTLPQRYVPWLAETDVPDRTGAEWRSLFRQTVRDIAHDSSPELDHLAIDDETPDWRVDLATCALISRNYPTVKRDLIDWGYPADEVERMPIGRAVALHQQEAYRRVTQQTAKWAMLPHRAVDGQDEREQQQLEQDGWLAHGWSGRETIPIVTTLLPTFEQAHEAEARGTMRPIALMALEAIRMHAWENGGRLPASLEEITVVPVPDNPATGKPFPYRLEGDTASLDVATTLDPEDATWYWRVEMRIDPEWKPSTD